MTGTTRLVAHWRDPAVFVACGFGSGFVPKAPGTFGSLAALLVWVVLLEPLHLLVQITAIVLVIILGTWLIRRVQARYELNDPGAIVIDEFAGQWIALIGAPAGPMSALLGFALFRLFDIWKPWPVGLLERRTRGAWGVMVDDIAAGIMALGVLQFTVWVSGGF